MTNRSFFVKKSGSTEGRFRVTYCPAHLTKEEIEGKFNCRERKHSILLYKDY